MALTEKELDRRFTYSAPTNEDQVIFETIRGKGRAFAEYVNAFVPEGREQALALTHMEQAIMWANAAVARK